MQGRSPHTLDGYKNALSRVSGDEPDPARAGESLGGTAS